MNIHDIYLVYVYVNSDISYDDYDSSNYLGKYVRRTFVIRNKKKYSYDNVTYTDLISGNTLKACLGDCDVGEEYVNHKLEFVTLVSYLGLSPYETKYNDISRKQVLKLISNKIKQDEAIKNNNDIIVFCDKKEKIKNTVKHKNRMLCRAMRLIKKDKGEDE